jgi:hypothetical protein
MSDLQPGKFPCPSCGKQYTWKPALAGKKAKCTCGNVITVPDLSPSAEPEDIYDIAETPAPAAQPKKGATVAAVAPITPAVAPKRVAAAPAPGLAPAAAAPARMGIGSAGYIPNRKRGPEPADKKKIFIPILLVILLAGSASIGFFVLKGHGPKKPSLDQDAYVEECLQDGATDDIEKWLEASNRRMVMGMTNSQALGQAQSLKKMGAKRVICFGASMTREMAIELPADPAQRKALFDWEHEHYTELGKPPSKDIGQKYLRFDLHL